LYLLRLPEVLAVRGLPRIDKLSWRLGVSIALLVIVSLAAGFLLVYRHYYSHFLEANRRNAAVEARLIRQALEYQMLEKDRRLIRQMVSSFTHDRTVQRVMILDRTGRVRISSDPAIGERHFTEASPTCRVCHRHPADQRSRSTMLEVDEGRVLRCVEPLPNRPVCHRCHDAAHKINGLIIVDRPLDRAFRELERSVSPLVLGTGVVGLVLVAGIGLVFRRFVLRRLFRFEATARAITEGDLDCRVPTEGDDALTRVEDQFNRMADSVTHLLARLREQRASLEKVMNSVDDGMLVLDRSRQIVATNEALRRRFPGVAGELIGHRCCDATQTGGLGCGFEDGSQGECPTLRCFESGQVQTAIRTRTAADGTVRQEEVLCSPVHSDDGSISHVVEVWRDITDRRSAEARLAEYQRLVSLGMLASGFSHEVNTPLASIGTCLDGIKRICGQQQQLEAELTEQVADLARTASSQVQRCGAITQQFLQLASGKTLARGILDLHGCAEAVIRLCRQTAQKAGVRVELAKDCAHPSVLANGSAVQQVLLNLVLNAVEASERGQLICISCQATEQVQVLVQDEGRGIPPEDLARVFEPFFTRRDRGTGLGLFVSMNLARSWGGDILVESELGRGTTMRVTFPRAGEDQEQTDGAHADPAG
jgi:signal transduction histidine kinase/HAMP domain-containing protein